jgi:hypothetical protein
MNSSLAATRIGQFYDSYGHFIGLVATIMAK